MSMNFPFTFMCIIALQLYFRLLKCNQLSSKQQNFFVSVPFMNFGGMLLCAWFLPNPAPHLHPPRKIPFRALFRDLSAFGVLFSHCVSISSHQTDLNTYPPVLWYAAFRNRPLSPDFARLNVLVETGHRRLVYLLRCKHPYFQCFDLS